MSDLRFQLGAQVQCAEFILRAHPESDVEAVIRLCMREAVLLAAQHGCAEVARVLTELDHEADQEIVGP